MFGGSLVELSQTVGGLKAKAADLDARINRMPSKAWVWGRLFAVVISLIIALTSIIGALASLVRLVVNSGEVPF